MLAVGPFQQLRRVIVAADLFLSRIEIDHTADRKSTRLNSSHGYISYAVFCLKKKNLYSFRAVQPNTPRGRNHGFPPPEPPYCSLPRVRLDCTIGAAYNSRASSPVMTLDTSTP